MCMNLQKIIKNKKQFLALTTLYLAEFSELLPYFSARWHQFIKHFDFFGKRRKKPLTGPQIENATRLLKSDEEKLFFILYFLSSPPRSCGRCQYLLREAVDCVTFHTYRTLSIPLWILPRQPAPSAPLAGPPPPRLCRGPRRSRPRPSLRNPTNHLLSPSLFQKTIRFQNDR